MIFYLAVLLQDPNIFSTEFQKGEGAKKCKALAGLSISIPAAEGGGLKRGLKGDKAVLIMPPLPPRSSGADREQMHHLGPRGKRATQ